MNPESARGYCIIQGPCRQDMWDVGRLPRVHVPFRFYVATALSVPSVLSFHPGLLTLLLLPLHLNQLIEALNKPSFRIFQRFEYEDHEDINLISTFKSL